MLKLVPRLGSAAPHDARYQNAEKRKHEFEDRMREKKARHQARKHAAALGSGGHGVPREAHPEPLQTEMELDDQHRGRIREREEEDTTAMQEVDTGGEMTAVLGTKSDAMRG